MKREFIFTDQWSDIVFKNRNQLYGAYMLRKRLPRNILIGYLTALLFMGTVVFTAYQFSKISLDDLKSLVDELPPPLVYVIPETPPVTPPETTPPAKNTPPKTSVETLVPVIKNNIDDSDTIEIISRLSDVSASKDTSGLSSEENNKTGSGSTEPKGISESAEPLPFYRVEKKPEFPGGEKAMIRFIQKNTHVPREYLDDEISMTAYISFIVDSTGKVDQVKPENSFADYPKLTDEAIRTVTKMPRWIPGRQNGKNVSVIMTLPVRFSVKKNF